MADRNDQDPLLIFFQFSLDDKRRDREVNRLFSNTAETLCQMMPASSQRSISLQKLLEAKQAAVLAWLYENPVRPFIEITEKS